jgi:hypothetical protein
MNVTEELFYITDHETRGEGLAHDTDLAQIPHPEWVPLSIQQYAGDVNGLLWRWHSHDGQPEAQGGFELLTLQEIYLSNWKGVVYFDSDTPNKVRMQTFKPVDFFIDEACVGLFHDERADPELYLYTFEDKPEPLGVDIGGYLQLLTLSLGFYYWQLLVIELARPNSPRPYVPARDAHRNQDLLDFVDTMSQLYPPFNLEAFVALYDQVRLRH